jgi:hypothetical protein
VLLDPEFAQLWAHVSAALDRCGVELREITGPVPPTPWDPELQRAMERAARAVDEERMMDAMLAEHGSSG